MPWGTQPRQCPVDADAAPAKNRPSTPDTPSEIETGIFRRVCHPARMKYFAHHTPGWRRCCAGHQCTPARATASPFFATPHTAARDVALPNRPARVRSPDVNRNGIGPSGRRTALRPHADRHLAPRLWSRFEAGGPTEAETGQAKAEAAGAAARRTSEAAHADSPHSGLGRGSRRPSHRCVMSSEKLSCAALNAAITPFGMRPRPHTPTPCSCAHARMRAMSSSWVE